MKKRVTAVLSMAVCTALVLGACSPKQEDVFTGDKTEQPAYQANLNAISPSAYADAQNLDLEPGTYISVIGKAENTSYWKQVKAGVEQAAKDLNKALRYTGEDKIKVLFNAPAAGEDIDEQVNILDEELARYPDVIAIASIDEEASAVQFDLATENGIPVVAFDSGNSYQGIQSTCKTNNVEAAAAAAKELCEAIDGDGEIVLIVHDSVSGNAKEREKGVRDMISSGYPDVSIVETIYMDKLEDLKRSAAAEQLGVSAEDFEKVLAGIEGESTQEDSQNGEKNNSGQNGGADSGDDQNGDGVQAEQGQEGTSGESGQGLEERAEEVLSLAQGMSDEDAVAYYMEKHPELSGCFGTNASATQLGVAALKKAELSGNDGEKQEAAENKEEPDAKDADSAAKPDAKDADSAAGADEKGADSAAGADEKAAGENNGGMERQGVVVMGFDAGKEQIASLEKGEVSGLLVQNPFGTGYAAVIASARTVLEIGNEAEVDTGYVWVTKDNLEDKTVSALLYE